MRNYFTFNGTDSRTFGVYISGQGTFSAPARAYNLLTIPGRNGALVGSEKRLENKDLTYPAFIVVDFDRSLAALRSFLLSQVGYKKLQDSYHPDEYRKALFVGPLDPDVEESNKEGKFNLVFNCMPQRFLVSGDEVTTLTASGTITNPTLFPAQPLLRVYGAGTLGIGSETIMISQADVYTDIDCEMMDAYKGTVSKNALVSVSGDDFPVLGPGTNNISLGSGISRVEITPRWWRV